MLFVLLADYQKDSIGQQLILTISCLIHTKSLNLHKHLQEYGIYQRISQSMDRENSPIDCFLEQTACIVRRSKIATGTLKPTESYKRRQIEELKSFADSFNLWIDLSDLDKCKPWIKPSQPRSQPKLYYCITNNPTEISWDFLFINPMWLFLKIIPQKLDRAFLKRWRAFWKCSSAFDQLALTNGMIRFDGLNDASWATWEYALMNFQLHQGASCIWPRRVGFLL